MAWLKRISSGQQGIRARANVDEPPVSPAKPEYGTSASYESAAKPVPAKPVPAKAVLAKVIQAIPSPKEKIGFTIHSSLNGDSSEMHLASPTLTVAKARMLFKSGRRVHVVNAAGRQFAPSEFDDILKFD